MIKLTNKARIKPKQMTEITKSGIMRPLLAPVV